MSDKDDIARMDWESNFMADEPARNAQAAAREDSLKQPAQASPAAVKASKDDVSKQDGDANVKAAAKDDEAHAAEAKESLGRGGSPSVDSTGVGGATGMSDRDRAALDRRLQLAKDDSRIEQRPETHPGLKSAQPDHTDYTVERELRQQWPLSYDGEDEDGGSQSA